MSVYKTTEFVLSQKHYIRTKQGTVKQNSYNQMNTMYRFLKPK